VIDDQPEDQPAPDAEETTPEVPEAPPEAEVTGDANEASKVDVEADAEPADPPARAQDPEGEPAAPETQPLGQGEPDAAPAEADDAPRAKPEIPGADLEPDIVLDSDAVRGREEGSEYSEDDPEAAAEGESEDAAPQPIAGATINLGKDARYTATGKRKTAVARVILKPGKGEYVINGKSLDVFFPRPTLQRVIRQPLETVGYESRMDVVALMHGGGVSAQAGALRHGVARALIEADPNLRGELKRRGFLTRDPRVKERKKAGLKKARKRPQFSKR
jgi:small subunit ribosomal protein S9